ERISFEDGTTDYSYLYDDNATADLDGITLELGLMVWLAEYVKAGMTISTPSKLYYDGDGSNSYTGTSDDGTPWVTDDEYYYIEEEFTIPMKFTGGLCFEVETLVLAADLSFSDYSQTEYNNLKLSSGDDPGRDILESVFSYSIGAEYTIPGTTFSLRAGYCLEPLKIKGMDELSYITDTPEIWRIDTEYDFVDITDERQFFTLGAGSVIDDVLALDVGVVFGSYERKTRYLTDQRDIMEIVVTGAYRF
ncbi:MAG TPA: hypothetical protein VLA34_15240, partial [Candidatus Krumholzibacterium sp.]|nr:hypothetical protein [Candidatus Krumholzibacterium sp.]